MFVDSKRRRCLTVDVEVAQRNKGASSLYGDEKGTACIGTSASSDLILPARRCRLALARRDVLREQRAAQALSAMCFESSAPPR